MASTGGSGSLFNPWIGVVGTLLGVLFGAGIVELRSRQEKWKGLQGHLEAVALEIQMINALASGYLEDGVQSPVYRFPTIAFEKSLPELLTRGIFDAQEASALQHFLIDLQAINRSLDYAHSLITKHEEMSERDKSLFNREIDRAKKKIKRFSSSAEGNSKLYKPAIDAVKKHLPGTVLQRISFDIKSDD